MCDSYNDIDSHDWLGGGVRQPIELRILSLYAGGSEAEAFNISEISRKTGAAYPHTYHAVKQLIQEGLLEEKRYGKARYCTANLSHPLTRNLLIRATLAGSTLPKQSREAFENLRREIERLTLEHPQLLAALFDGKRLFFLVSTKRAARRIGRDTFLFNITFYTPEEFRKALLNNPELLSMQVLFGHERLLLLLSKVQERILFQHSLARHESSHHSRRAVGGGRK